LWATLSRDLLCVKAKVEHLPVLGNRVVEIRNTLACEKKICFGGIEVLFQSSQQEIATPGGYQPHPVSPRTKDRGGAPAPKTRLAGVQCKK
jgi:hypothetical protein